jgi:hypothetical protein
MLKTTDFLSNKPSISLCQTGINARQKNLPEEAFRIQKPGVRRYWLLAPGF